MNRREFAKSAIAAALLGGLTDRSAVSQENTTMAKPTPFKIAISDDQLADLKARLSHTRWPDEPAGAGWMTGTNLDYMKKLTAYWLHDYDWRKAEASLNALPNYKVDIEGIDLHFIHQPRRN